MVIQPYDDSFADIWDELIEKSALGTLLHTRRFLSYHRNRFKDFSLLVFDEKQQLLAVFPAAILPSNKSVVVSHPGITYGGVIGSEKCRGEVMIRALQVICDYYKARKIAKLWYKSVPFVYHRMPMQDDLYALFRKKAVRYRCDLSATIDLENRGRVGSRRVRGHKKAIKSGILIQTGAEYIESLWNVLSANLQKKHGAKPVHSIAEISFLLEHFPGDIQVVVALRQGLVEAGVVLFHTEMVSHAQYIASSERGYACNALDAVFEHCFVEAERKGARYFDFGTSNEDAGLVLNGGLYSFKTEFGAGGIVHEFYELNLLEDY